jgi:RNA polymerase sigma factor (sigma-70 family)
MAREEADAVNGRHPFDEDPGLHARITQVMTAAVQRTLRRGPVRSDREPVVLTGGESIEGVVQEAMSKLWSKDPEAVQNYEALAYTIAVRTAIDQIRRSRAHRWYYDAKGNKKEITVSYLSEPTSSSAEGEEPPTIGDALTIDDPDDDAHDHFVRTRRAIIIGDLADALPERDREIFYARFFDGDSYASIAETWGLTSERVRQIYKARFRELNATARAMPEFEAEDNDPEGDEGR